MRVRYSFEDDWTGDPSIFFRVVITDETFQKNRPADLSQHIQRTIEREVKPDEQGLNAYFNYPLCPNKPSSTNRPGPEPTMPYPDHLLEQAKHLAKREKNKPRQASLRPAVSTAYYALFHLLVDEATLTDQRALLARFFEHGKMKAASDRQRGECNRYLNSSPPSSLGAELDCMRHLHLVAETFSQVQQERHRADYDNSQVWTRADVLTLIDRVDAAFQSWHQIRDESSAQSYLISLLGNPRVT